MPKRTFSRLPLHLEATITYNGTIVDGDVEDISLQGVFFRTEQQIKPHDTVQVTVYSHSKENQVCQVRARVVRTTPDGVALEFEKNLLD
jgi:hypothetical protein